MIARCNDFKHVCVFAFQLLTGADPKLRYADSAIYADGSGCAPALLSQLSPSTCGGGFRVQSQVDGFWEATGGALVLLKTPSGCKPTQQSAITFLQYMDVIDLMDSSPSSGAKSKSVSLVVPLEQMILQSLPKQGWALFHLTGMKETEKHVEYIAAACYKAPKDVTMEAAIEMFQAEIMAAEGIRVRSTPVPMKKRTAEAEAEWGNEIVSKTLTPNAKRTRRSDSLTSPPQSC